MEYINEQYDPAMSWKDAEYCIKRWGGPFAIKGLMSVEDAKRAVDIGASAILLCISFQPLSFFIAPTPTTPLDIFICVNNCFMCLFFFK